MWISILNYATGQIEVADLSEYEEETGIHDAEQLAESWLRSNCFHSSFTDTDYMVTEEAPYIYDHNTQNYIDMPL